MGATVTSENLFIAWIAAPWEESLGGDREPEAVYCSRQGSFLPTPASVQAENCPHPHPNFRGHIYFYYLDEENVQVSPKEKVTETYYFNTS